MTEKNTDANSELSLQLTPDIITALELNRVIRELETLDDFLHQANIRTPGSSMSLPKTTKSLEELAEANGFSLLDTVHRKHLIGKLRNFKLKVKKVHISFAVEPSPKIIQKIVLWMRDNIHPHLVVEVGIQPNISVGCIVRTTNKVFDMSLRNRFSNSKTILAGLMENKQ
ncbi:MAG TPA: F0F1 ATP synthase subunit delta [Patescibacteria group bacterium]|nr:F0F1 ATP synthase subunit delta [Patescibacteria group bacterium]